MYQLRKKRYLRSFLETGNVLYWGQFPSAAEAMSFLPARLASSYENPDLVDLNLDVFMETHLFDWPVLFHLQRYLTERKAQALTDFGGHVGVKYYAFRQHLRLPDSFNWQVVDTPAMVLEGRSRAAEAGVKQLSFFEKLGDSALAPILFCSGSLQYVDGTLETILAEASYRPELIILNKVPLCDRGEFFTLESFRDVRLAYHIFGTDDHAKMRGRLGYRLVSQWHIPHRDFRVPYGDPRDEVKMYGEVWEDATQRL